MPEVSPNQWEDFTRGKSAVHLLQTVTWGKFKHFFGWESRYILVGVEGQNRLGAQILFRRLPLGFSIAYIPKGPVMEAALLAGSFLDWNPFLTCLDQVCRQLKSIFVLIEPDLWKQDIEGIPPGLEPENHTIQPGRTIVLDLLDTEEVILSRMKQKTRYNIRLAQKKGVFVEKSKDVATFYQMMQVTSERDGFGVHTFEYYQRIFELFHPIQECELFIATYQGQPIAGLMAFLHGDRAWYFYGASHNSYRELMAPYLLQWEAIRWAKAHGCSEYDLWGIPDEDEEALEAEFLKRSGGLWGVYRFKRGFGGEIRQAAGPWRRVYYPTLFSVYKIWQKLRKQTIS